MVHAILCWIVRECHGVVVDVVGVQRVPFRRDRILGDASSVVARTFRW